MITVLLLSTLLVLAAILISAYVLTRRDQGKRWAVPLIASLVAVAILIWWLLHPICVPL